MASFLLQKKSWAYRNDITQSRDGFVFSTRKQTYRIARQDHRTAIACLAHLGASSHLTLASSVDQKDPSINRHEKHCSKVSIRFENGCITRIVVSRRRVHVIGGIQLKIGAIHIRHRAQHTGKVLWLYHFSGLLRDGINTPFCGVWGAFLLFFSSSNCD